MAAEHCGAARRAGRGLAGEEGGLTVLMVFLVPAFILIFAAALDISKLNAQRRYVQAQADLSALSAVQRLPRVPDSRQVAGEVIRRNTTYGVLTVADSDVIFGHFGYGVGFTPGADQSAESGFDAVSVRVRSPYDPLLLGPFLAGNQVWVVREAVAARQDPVSITLRNALLTLDSRESILDALLGEQLGLRASLLSYQGLAGAQVTLEQLAGIVSTSVSSEVLTFEEVLDADVGLGQLLAGLVNAGLLPAGVVQAAPPVTVRLGELLEIDPDLVASRIDGHLPDVGLSVFDLLVALAQFSGKETHHLIGISAGLNAPPLADPALGIGIVDPGVTAIGLANSATPVSASVAQIDAEVTAQVAGLVAIAARLRTAAATAEVVMLDCRASDPEDVVARLRVRTDTATLALHVRLLSKPGDKTYSDAESIPILGNSHLIDVKLKDVGKPIKVPNPILLSSLTDALTAALTSIRGDLTSAKGGIIGALLNPILMLLLNTLNSLIGSLGTLLADTPLLNGAVQAVLDLLGIDVAAAEVILNGYDCTSALVQ